ncbi:hypothetical protein N7539_008686, partial [Penicillium diatomitis]
MPRTRAGLPVPSPPEPRGPISTAPRPPPQPPNDQPRRKNCELDVNLRTQITTLKDVAKWSYRQMHEKYPHIPPSTIKMTCFRSRIRHKEESRERSGRPKILDDDDRQKILQKIHENPRSSYDDLLSEVDHKCKDLSESMSRRLDVYTCERICELKFTLKWGARRIQKYRFPDIPLSTISYTLTMKRKRMNGASLARAGPPRKLSEEDRDRVYDAIQTNPSITREDLLKEVDYKVKTSSIWRLTHEMGLRKWRKMDRPYLTPEHAAERLSWALTYRHYTPEDWKRVFWSDETTIERGQGARKEWTFIPPWQQLQERSEGVQMSLSKGKQIKQMFWACFAGSPRKTGLIPLYGDPEAEKKGITKEVIHDLYQRILPTLLDNEDAIFQHDNAPTHTALIVRALLRELNIT